jgi:hypothetical protein
MASLLEFLVYTLTRQDSYILVAQTRQYSALSCMTRDGI